MLRLTAIVSSELKKKIWNSPLQLVAAGMIIYYLAMVTGSTYACGPGNTDVAKGVFKCSDGNMAAAGKLLIVAGIAGASLCMGRAVSLLERLWQNAR